MDSRHENINFSLSSKGRSRLARFLSSPDGWGYLFGGFLL